jgi:hypothetical protein
VTFGRGGSTPSYQHGRGKQKPADVDGDRAGGRVCPQIGKERAAPGYLLQSLVTPYEVIEAVVRKTFKALVAGLVGRPALARDS